MSASRRWELRAHNNNSLAWSTPGAMLMDTTRQSSIMTQASRTAMIWRWILVPCASIAAFYGAIYFSLFVLFFGPFPKDLADPTAAFLMTSFIRACRLVCCTALPSCDRPYFVGDRCIAGDVSSETSCFWRVDRRTRRHCVRRMVVSSSSSCAANDRRVYRSLRRFNRFSRFRLCSLSGRAGTPQSH